jgi:uncharacterized membrane protein
MKILVIVIGTILVLGGVIFTAQSKSLLGPQSSFMYSNPSWTINGFMFIIAGIVALVLAIIFNIGFRDKLKHHK